MLIKLKKNIKKDPGSYDPMENVIFKKHILFLTGEVK